MRPAWSPTIWSWHLNRYHRAYKYESQSGETSRMELLPCWKHQLLEKLTVAKLVKKFLASYGTRRFITVFTRVRQMNTIRILKAQSLWSTVINILPSMPSWSQVISSLQVFRLLYLFPLGFRAKIGLIISPLHAPPHPPRPPWLDHSKIHGEEYE
jgi:hypothetical protein